MRTALHPLAWWAWALALAGAASRVSDVRVVALLLVVVVTVVLVGRDDSPWARAFPAYLVLGACIVVVRVAFHVVVGIKTPGRVVLDLPRIPAPDWAVGVELLGPVTTTGLATAATAGLKLALLVVCFGAANALANPKRALRALPASLHHLGSAMVIAISVTPQLVTAAAGVRRAQRLRGTAGRAWAGIAVAVLTDALDRSLALAASMDSRGYARTLPGRSDRRVGALLLVAVLAAAVGTYGLLGGASAAQSIVLLTGGAASAAVASVLAGRQVSRSRYRPDAWGAPETVVALAGASAALLLVVPGAGAGSSPLGVAAVGAAVLAAVPLLAAREVLR